VHHRPEEVVRYTVEKNGGKYTATVLDVMSLFGRKQLTDRARWRIRQALLDQGVVTDPDLLVADRSEELRLFLGEPAPGAAVAPGPPGVAPVGRGRLLPATWKGWTAYGVAVLVILAVVAGDSDNADNNRPAADTVNQEAPGNEAGDRAAERAQVRQEREELRKERAQHRRQRAAARRERARARRARAAAREQELQRQQAAVAAEPEPAANCHPSYDPCLDPNASDYDCEGGSGDGPEYTGYVIVKGPDDYGLDSDGDGTGCES
jgi:hypothetical protein